MGSLSCKEHVVIHYLSTSDIAKWFKVDPKTVYRWWRRYPKDSDHPFPEPASVTGSERPVPGWLLEQETAIREWYASRPGQGAGGGRPRQAAV
jgi:transposase-like protein